MTEVVVCPPEVCHFVEAVVWKKTGLAFVMPAALKCPLTPEVLEMGKRLRTTEYTVYEKIKRWMQYDTVTLS